MSPICGGWRGEDGSGSNGPPGAMVARQPGAARDRVTSAARRYWAGSRIRRSRSSSSSGRPARLAPGGLPARGRGRRPPGGLGCAVGPRGRWWRVFRVSGGPRKITLVASRRKSSWARCVWSGASPRAGRRGRSRPWSSPGGSAFTRASPPWDSPRPMSLTSHCPSLRPPAGPYFLGRYPQPPPPQLSEADNPAPEE
jgi:hypothetical protein